MNFSIQLTPGNSNISLYFNFRILRNLIRAHIIYTQCRETTPCVLRFIICTFPHNVDRLLGRGIFTDLLRYVVHTCEVAVLDSVQYTTPGKTSGG